MTELEKSTIHSVDGRKNTIWDRGNLVGGQPPTWKHDSDQCFEIHLLDIPGGLWLGAHLPTQGMVKEESTCHGATEHESRDY